MLGRLILCKPKAKTKSETLTLKKCIFLKTLNAILLIVIVLYHLTQWPAVKTYLSLMRVPPQWKRPPLKIATSQGCLWGEKLVPPTTRRTTCFSGFLPHSTE